MNVLDEQLTSAIVKLIGASVLGVLVLAGRVGVYVVRAILAWRNDMVEDVVSLKSQVAKLESWKVRTETAVSNYYKGSASRNRVRPRVDEFEE